MFSFFFLSCSNELAGNLMIDIWYAFIGFHNIVLIKKFFISPTSHKLISFSSDANEQQTHQVWRDNKAEKIRFFWAQFWELKWLIYGNFSVLFNYSPFRLCQLIQSLKRLYFLV